MDFKILIALCLTLLPAACLAFNGAVEDLDLPFLSELRVRFRRESRPQQCSLYWLALSLKLGISLEKDNRELIDRVDTSLLSRVSDSVKDKNKSLYDYLKDCATLIKLLQQSRSSNSTVETSPDVDSSQKKETKKSDNVFKNVSKKAFQKITDLGGSKEESPEKENEKFRKQIAELEAEREALKKELDSKNNQLKVESVMHQADVVAVGVKEKALRKELMKRNEELVAELDNYVKRIFELEFEAGNMKAESAKRQEELQEKILEQHSDLASKSNDGSTKSRELELSNRVNELEEELLVERKRNEVNAASSLTDRLMLQQGKSVRESFVKGVMDENTTLKSELETSNNDLDLTRKGLSKTSDELSKCYSQSEQLASKLKSSESRSKDIEAKLGESVRNTKDCFEELQRIRESWKKEKSAKEDALLRLEKGRSVLPGFMSG